MKNKKNKTFSEIDVTGLKFNRAKNGILVRVVPTVSLVKYLSALLLFSLIFLLIFTAGKSSANILINEVMYNPEQNDNYNEWIEYR